jgi:type IV secretory pathway VirB3-like protein
MDNHDIWYKNPMILFHPHFFYEIFPFYYLSDNSKINATVRLIILLTMLSFIISKSFSYLFVGIITLLFFYLFSIKTIEPFTLKKKGKKVSFDSILNKEFHQGKEQNPFSNVLLTEIEDTPERLSAPPTFHPVTQEKITNHVKQTIQELNPTIENTDKQLFSSLYDQFQLDQSNRAFYSTPNTQVVPGNQTAFANYLYGNMPSGKESNAEGAFARVQDNYRWIQR